MDKRRKMGKGVILLNFTKIQHNSILFAEIFLLNVPKLKLFKKTCSKKDFSKKEKL